MATPPQHPSRRSRTRILDVAPHWAPGLDRPRAVAGQWVTVSATLARDGAPRVTGLLRTRPAGTRRWELAPLQVDAGGRAEGAFVPEEPGRLQVQLDAWISGWAAWRADVEAKIPGFGRDDWSAEIAAGRALLEPWSAYPFVEETLRLADEATADVFALVALLGVEALPDQLDLARLPRALEIDVDPEAAHDGVWVELPAGLDDPAALAGAALRVAALGAGTVLLPGTVVLGGTAGSAGTAPAGDADGLDPARARVLLAALAPAAEEAGLRVALRVHAAGCPPEHLAAELAGWVQAGVTSFEAADAAAVPLPHWDAAAEALRAARPDVLLCAGGPLRPEQERALGGAGFAQATRPLHAVPGDEEAAALSAPAPRNGLVHAARPRAVAAGGGALAAAAFLCSSFGLEGATGNGATALLGALLEARRTYPALQPGAEAVLLDAGPDVLAVLRRTALDEALLLASRNPDEAATARVTLPAAGNAGAAGCEALDLLRDGERRRPWAQDGQDVELAPGGFELLRIERY